MTEELELKLVEKYPKILKDYKGHVMKTCMAFGIEVGNGWYDILDNCMEKLQYLCDLFSTEKLQVQVQVVAAQIKEKFGTLRFYVDIHNANELQTKILYGIIDDAERKSYRTCEESGKDGKTCAQGRRIKTLSYEEARKLKYVAIDEKIETYWKKLDKDNSNEKLN